MATFPLFSETALDMICRTLADAVSHKEVTLLLSQGGIEERGGNPRWERMLLALSVRQKQDRCGNNALAFFCQALHPARFGGKPEEFETFRAAVNYQLAFYGLAIDAKGQPQRVAAATTIPEATRRANELRAELTHRSVHPDVLRYCHAELLQDNYFHCVLEAAKSVAQKVRDMTGLEKDGAALVDQVFSVAAPRMALNTLRTESEQSEQKGFASLLKGVFGTFRNVTAHAPKIAWAVNRTDALDALTILSYLHRRLDEAVVVPVLSPGAAGSTGT
ncbi:MAG: TIGR02391 family protein [Gemmataceae bacterium]